MVSLINIQRYATGRSGQILVFFAITALIYGACLFGVYNVGYMVGERMRLQNISDAAAFSGATWAARCYNYIAYTNRAAVAQLSFLCFLIALTSHLNAWERLTQIASFIPYVGAVFAVVNRIIGIIKQIVEKIVDLPVWELTVGSILAAQFAMSALIGWKLLDCMTEVAREYDPRVKINTGAYSSAHAINIANATSIIQVGKWEDLAYVLKETAAPWTKGQYSGLVPLVNRTYKIMPKPWKFPPIPNFGIEGSIDIKSDKIQAEDWIFMEYWTFKKFRWRMRKSYLVRFHKSRRTNMKQFKFLDYKRGNNTAVGIYAVAEKSYSDMSNLIKQSLMGYYNVPNQPMRTISKAVARYEDPVPSSQRHRVLSQSSQQGGWGGWFNGNWPWGNNNASNSKEPNLWNPFWHAELVSCEANQDEDRQMYVSNGLIMGVCRWLGYSTLKKH